MNDQVKPWYREPMVWMVIAIPATAVVVGMIMIYLSVDSYDGLVVDDYYKQGLAINRKIERDEKAAMLRLSAEIEIDTVTGFIKAVLDAGELDSLPAELYVLLSHAVHGQQDSRVVLRRGIGSQYVGAVDNGISEGIWYFELSDRSGADGEPVHTGWRLSRRARLQGQTRLSLQPQI